MKIQNTRRTKKKKNGAEVFKIIIVENFAKLMTDTKSPGKSTLSPRA